MKNISVAFEQIKELQNSLAENKIVDSESLLVQLFCAAADKEYIAQIQSFFSKHLPKSTLIGTTTDGVLNSKEIYYKTKSVATFSLFEKTKLQSSFIKYEKGSSCSYTAGLSLAKSLVKKDLKLIISFTDGIHTNGEDFVNGISEVLPNVVLAGGMAGDNGELKETYVFDKESLSDKAAVCVALRSKELHISTGYNFDWIPIGKKMRVTKAIKNRVYELDGKPIVDIYAKYMGNELAKKLPQIGIEFPLIFEKNGLSIGRAVLAKHEDGSLTFAGNIDEYDTVRFGVGDTGAILNNSSYTLNSFIQGYGCKIEGMFIYSCMARRRFLEEYIAHELEAISSISNASGFFSYGEFFHFQNQNELLNESMTFIAISENCDVKNDVFIPDEDLEQKKSFVSIQHVLANLANTVSNELAELNENLEQRVRENSAYIFKQAYTSQLTGLPNRISLINALDNHIGHILVLINIDDFTTINDFYGYKVGDEVLQKVGSVLENFSKLHNSRAYKLSSDEFAVVVKLKNRKEDIEHYLKELISEVESAEYFFHESEIHIGVTVGAALINTERTGMINADMTLKLAKAQGEGYMVFDEDLQLAQKYEHNAKMANIIKKALATDNIIPFFQPIIDVDTMEIIKYEALVRLREPDGNLLPPVAFLEISQKIRLYEYISKVMIEKTFQFFAQNGYDFSINLAFSDIVSPRVRPYLFEKIKEYGIAKQLTIEILETQEFEDVNIVFDFVEEVYQHNAKIAIDDFGSGYANFEYITNIRSDYMKIDGSLIKKIDTDTNARIITETIIAFGKKLNKKVVAEFVHSKEVFELVKYFGVDYVQGYYLGEPKEFI